MEGYVILLQFSKHNFAITGILFGTGILMTIEENCIQKIFYCSSFLGNNWTSRIFCGPNLVGTLQLWFKIVNPGLIVSDKIVESLLNLFWIHFRKICVLYWLHGSSFVHLSTYGVSILHVFFKLSMLL